MQIDTLLHTEHQLDQLADQFEHWRQSRSHLHDRIPDPLWEQAVALTAGSAIHVCAGKTVRWNG
jgi:hypothetical protein